MKKEGFIIFILIAGVVLFVKAGFMQNSSIMPLKTANVRLAAPNKLKRGRTARFQVQVDMSGVMASASTQLASYVIPISFDRSTLEFVSAAEGDSPGFAPFSITSPEVANASGQVTLVGSQTGTDAASGMVGVASLEFRVIASQKGKTQVQVNPELAEPGLSLSSIDRQAAIAGPIRLPATGQASTVKIK